METQPEATLETPKRRIRVRLPKKSDIKTFGAGLVAGATVATVATLRFVKRECACESETTEPVVTPDN